MAKSVTTRPDLRIEHHYAKNVLAILQPIEHVGLRALVRAAACHFLVELVISPCRRQRVRANIQVCDTCGAAAARTHREPARVTERVQHAPTFRQSAHDRAVVPLIEKKSGLLTSQHVRFEA